MKKIIISTIFIFALCGFVFAQTPRDAVQKVKEIKLLESTRDDVQRAFINYESDDYDFEEHSQDFYSDVADIEVFYSTGKCQENATANEEDEEEETRDDVAEIWNVAEWTATKIVIDFNEAVKIEDVGYDLSDFKKQKRFPDDDEDSDDEEADDEDSDSFIYHNKNLGIALIGDEKEIGKIIFYPSKGSHSKLCDNEKAKKFASDENWFGTNELEREACINRFADVTDLVLSAEELTADCAGKTKNKNRSEKVNKISVQTIAVDPENDVLTYNYMVSGGKIVGQGANVVWDLTGASPGTYTITAGVDDGCGVCGQTKTQAVIVKECTNSKRK
ncbi:MAG TPA: hypothetical protein VK308_11745 [Pyrinomonadaceae bacterium]|nr:hypothetical protein [Pyrinomonadaceae bacterium]